MNSKPGVLAPPEKITSMFPRPFFLTAAGNATGKFLQDSRIQLFWVWLGLVLAFPPFGVCWLAFFALIPLIRLILKPQRDKRLYLRLWLCGFLFWFCEAHFICSFDAVPLGVRYVLLGILASLLAVYFPLFVGISRVWLHQKWLICGAVPHFLQEVLRVQKQTAVLFVAPLAWAGCDILRCWFMSGYPLSSLCHAFWHWPCFIQTADLVGEWGVTASIVFFSSCLATCVTWTDGKLRPCWKALGGLALACAFIGLYGQWQLAQTCEPIPGTTLALLQGDTPAMWATDPESREVMTRQTNALYSVLAQQAKQQAQAEGRTLDLLVFPESIYRKAVSFAEPDADPALMEDSSGKPVSERVFQQTVEHSLNELRNYAKQQGAPIVTGGYVFTYSKTKRRDRNSAIYCKPTPDGEIELEFYHKMHLVPMGEYIPCWRTLHRWFPQVSMFENSCDAAREPVAFRIPASNGTEMNVGVNICFESALSRLIRYQLAELRRQGIEPDFLLNLTNNGWAYQSCEPPQHLACGIFRSVENRKPLFIAANHGISAVIDSNGRILQQVPTSQQRAILMHGLRDQANRHSLFTRTGHITLWIPVLFLLAGGVNGLWNRWHPTSPSSLDGRQQVPKNAPPQTVPPVLDEGTAEEPHSPLRASGQ